MSRNRKKKPSLIHSQIGFNLGKKRVVFDIVHTLPGNTPFGAALQNWAVRTDTHTVESFCEYMQDKHPMDHIVPKTVYDRLFEELGRDL